MRDPYTPTSADLEIAPLAKGPVGEGDLEVKLGDSAENIAHRAGLLVKTFWDDPANQALKDARKNPSTLLPGDRYTLPEPRVKEETCAQEKKHRFRRKPLVAKLEIRFLDDAGKPRSSLDYKLEIGREKPRKGKTDVDGVLKEDVPADAVDGVLELTWTDAKTDDRQKERHLIHFRCLGPLEEPVGIQDRLRNLGYYIGATDGRMGPMTQAAIAQFQIAQKGKLDVSGRADEATLSKVKDVYGQ